MAKLIFEASGKVDELNEQIEALDQMDKVIEAKKKKAGFGCLAVGVVLGLTALALFATGGKPWAVVLCGIAFAATVVMIVIYSRYALQDLDDRKVDVAKKLFGYLGKDVPPKAKCSVTVSFQKYDKHGELVSKEGGAFSTIKQYVYQDIWFRAKGALYDGNAFQVMIKETVKRKEKHKRKRVKVTEKFTENVVLALTLDSDAYPKFAEAESAVDQSAAVADMAIKAVSQDGQQLKVVATTGAQTNVEKLVDGDRVLATFMHVYQGLAACRG